VLFLSKDSFFRDCDSKAHVGDIQFVPLGITVVCSRIVRNAENPPGVTSRDLLPALSNASTNICPLSSFFLLSCQALKKVC